MAIHEAGHQILLDQPAAPLAKCGKLRDEVRGYPRGRKVYLLLGLLCTVSKTISQGECASCLIGSLDTDSCCR